MNLIYSSTQKNSIAFKKEKKREPKWGVAINPTHLTRIRPFYSPINLESLLTKLVSSHRALLFIYLFMIGSDRTNVCWVKEGCSSLQPKACSSLPLEVVDHLDKFDAARLNLHLNKGCYTGAAKLQAQLNNAPASCNPPCFRIIKAGNYCYMSTRNNNFSNRRHMGRITVTA